MSTVTAVKAPKANNDLRVTITTIKKVFGKEGNIAPELAGKVSHIQSRYLFDDVYNHYNASGTYPNKAELLKQAIEIQQATNASNEAKATKAKKTDSVSIKAKKIQQSNEVILSLVTDLTYWANKLSEASKNITDIKVRLAAMETKAPIKKGTKATQGT